MYVSKSSGTARSGVSDDGQPLGWQPNAERLAPLVAKAQRDCPQGRAGGQSARSGTASRLPRLQYPLPVAVPPPRPVPNAKVDHPHLLGVSEILRCLWEWADPTRPCLLPLWQFLVARRCHRDPKVFLIPASQRLWVFSAEEQPANASHFFHARSHCFTLSRFHTRVSSELEHDQAPKLGVLGLVNHTHPAAADPAQNAVMGNCLPHGLGGRGHWLDMLGGDEREVKPRLPTIPFLDTMSCAWGT